MKFLLTLLEGFMLVVCLLILGVSARFMGNFPLLIKNTLPPLFGPLLYMVIPLSPLILVATVVIGLIRLKQDTQPNGSTKYDLIYLGVVLLLCAVGLLIILTGGKPRISI